MLWKGSYEYDWIECGFCAGPHIPNRWAEYKVSTTSHMDYGLGGQNTKFLQLHIPITWAEYKSFNNFTYGTCGLGGQNTKFQQLHMRIRWAEYKVSTTLLTDYGLGGQNTKFQQLHIRIRWAEYNVSTTLLTDYGLGGQNTKFLQLHLPSGGQLVQFLQMCFI